MANARGESTDESISTENVETSSTDETTNDSQQTNTNTIEEPATETEPSVEVTEEQSSTNETENVAEPNAPPAEEEEEKEKEKEESNDAQQEETNRPVAEDAEELEQNKEVVQKTNAMTLAVKEWTLDDLAHTITFNRYVNEKWESVPVGTTLEVSELSQFTISYDIALPDVGTRVQPGEQLKFTLPQGVTARVKDKTFELDGKPIVTINITGSEVVATFQSDVINYNGVNVQMALDVKMFEASATDGEEKTVEVNKVAYTFKYKNPLYSTALFGKVGEAVSRDLIKWIVMPNYGGNGKNNGLTELTNVLVTDEFDPDLDLVEVPEDQKAKYPDRLIIDETFIIDICPTDCTGITVDYIKNSAGKVTSFKLNMNKPLDASQHYQIVYFTNAFDNGNKRAYTNNATMTYDEGEPVSQSIKNKEFSGGVTGSQVAIKLAKVDENDNPLAGATFKLEKFNPTTNNWDFVLEEPAQFGQAYYDGLTYGKFRLTETVFPTNYNEVYYSSALSSGVQKGNSYEFEILSADVSESSVVDIKIKNELAKASFELTKVDADDNSIPLAGAVFELVNDNDSSIRYTLTTNSAGKASVTGITPGTYTLTETAAPDGYAKDSTLNKTYTFVPGASLSDSVTNKKFGNVTIIKEDGTYKSVKLKDVEFTLSNANQTYTATTDADGKAAFDKVVSGEYTLTETKTPQGYITMEPVIVTVKSGEQLTYTAVNKRDSYELTLTKVNSITKKPLAGVQFALERLNEDTNEYTEVGTIETTNSNGVIEYKELEKGTYRVKEVAALPGFDKGDYSLPIQLNEDAMVTVENTPYSTVLITKVDSVETSMKLDGAQFELYKYNNETNSYERYDQTIYTTVNGEVKIERLPVGKYELKEIVAPYGYLLLGGNVQFEVTLANMDAPAQIINVEVKNDKISGKVTLTKIDKADNKPLAGAVFTLQIEQAPGVYVDYISNNVTNSNGQIIVDGLALGNYRLLETAAPFGYKANSTPIPFVISESQVDHKFEFPNEKFYGEFKLTKVEGETNTVIPGTEFTLSKVNANNTLVLEKLVTDAQGMIAKNGLEAGSYQLIETKAAPGYYIDQTPITFTIGENATNSVNNELQDGMALVHDFTFKNHQILGEFKLTKVDQDDSSIALDNVQFQLSKWNETTKQYEPIRDIFTTDKNGVISSGALTVGQYELKEVKAADGYYLNATPITFTIGEGSETNTALTGGTAVKHVFTFTNKLIAGEFELTKIQQGNAQVVLPSVEFKLSKWNEATKAYDSVIEEKLVTDANGKIAKGELTIGQYRLVETKTLAGYYLNGTPIDFTIGIANRENTLLSGGTAIKHKFTFENSLIPLTPVDPEPVIPVDPEPVIPVDPEPVVPVDPEPVVPVDPEPVPPPNVINLVNQALELLNKFEEEGYLTIEDYNNLHEIYQLYLGMNPEERSQFEQHVDVAKLFALLNQQTRLPQTDAMSSTPFVMIGLVLILLSLFALRFRRNKA